MDSEEFYDVNTDEDEDDTLRESLKNGHVPGTDELDEVSVQYCKCHRISMPAYAIEQQ
jgi:hypothetical protein